MRQGAKQARDCATKPSQMLRRQDCSVEFSGRGLVSVLQMEGPFFFFFHWGIAHVIFNIIFVAFAIAVLLLTIFG
jgi:hypothetical protein